MPDSRSVGGNIQDELGACYSARKLENAKPNQQPQKKKKKTLKKQNAEPTVMGFSQEDRSQPKEHPMVKARKI